MGFYASSKLNLNNISFTNSIFSEICYTGSKQRNSYFLCPQYESNGQKNLGTLLWRCYGICALSFAPIIKSYATQYTRGIHKIAYL